MITRTALEVIARTRLREARVLFRSRHYDGAAYLCGYAVELALKARICRHQRWSGWPENRNESKWFQAVRTHDLDALLELSGVQARIRSVYVVEWAAIYDHWTPEVRYLPIGSFGASETLAMIQATAILVKALR
jgi:HEPN domain-containing protein